MNSCWHLLKKSLLQIPLETSSGDLNKNDFWELHLEVLLGISPGTSGRTPPQMPSVDSSIPLWIPSENFYSNSFRSFFRNLVWSSLRESWVFGDFRELPKFPKTSDEISQRRNPKMHSRRALRRNFWRILNDFLEDFAQKNQMKFLEYSQKEVLDNSKKKVQEDSQYELLEDFLEELVENTQLEILENYLRRFWWESSRSS